MFTLINLPYAIDALSPIVSSQTLEFHHGKHLKAYVDNLNKLVAGTIFEQLSLEELILLVAKSGDELASAQTRQAVFNNAGQILNHNLYFTQFKTPNQVGGDDATVMPGPATPTVMPGSTGHLKAQIEKQWGTLEAFQQDFVAKGVGLFGSGWVWLSAQPDGTLVITQEPGASNPICRTVPVKVSAGEPVEPPKPARLKPLLTFDVWEHAYYLDYQNRRAAHLEALWGIVDWDVIDRRYIGK